MDGCDRENLAKCDWRLLGCGEVGVHCGILPAWCVFENVRSELWGRGGSNYIESWGPLVAKQGSQSSGLVGELLQAGTAPLSVSVPAPSPRSPRAQTWASLFLAAPPHRFIRARFSQRSRTCAPRLERARVPEYG